MIFSEAYREESIDLPLNKPFDRDTTYSVALRTLIFTRALQVVRPAGKFSDQQQMPALYIISRKKWKTDHSFQFNCNYFNRKWNERRFQDQVLKTDSMMSTIFVVLTEALQADLVFES